MDVDAEPVEGERNSANEEERRTEDEQSTADDDTEDEAPEDEAPATRLPTRNTNNAKASGSGTASEPVPDTELPPSRNLPFAKKAPPTSTAASPDEGSETESEDDEL